MGYRGKVKEQEQARALRARNRTLADIAQTLGVSKSSVSLWVRDVPFTPTLPLRGPHRRPHPAHEAKLRQIEELNRAGRERIGTLSETEFLVAGRALRRRGSEGRWWRPVRKHRPGDDPLLLRLVAPLLRSRRITPSSTRLPARGSTWNALRRSGRPWPECRGGSSDGLTVRCPTRPFVTTARARLRVRVLQQFQDAPTDHGSHACSTIVGLHSGV